MLFVANKPALYTRSTSFTLPVELFEAVKRLAGLRMTDVSDVIRKALMNYLSPAERRDVEEAIARRLALAYPKHIDRDLKAADDGGAIPPTPKEMKRLEALEEARAKRKRKP